MQKGFRIENRVEQAHSQSRLRSWGMEKGLFVMPDTLSYHLKEENKTEIEIEEEYLKQWQIADSEAFICEKQARNTRKGVDFVVSQPSSPISSQQMLPSCKLITKQQVSPCPPADQQLKTSKTLKSWKSMNTTFTEPEHAQIEGHKVQQISRSQRTTVWKIKPYGKDGFLVRKRVRDAGGSSSCELDILALLAGHPYIVGFIDAYKISHSNGFALEIFTEYYPQGSLKDRIYIQGAIQLAKVKIYAYQIFRGLNFIHSCGICHRKIKSENIFVKGNNLVIGDFGAARFVDDGGAGMGWGIGEERAPELILGSRACSAKIDIWAAGCVIAQMILGRPLFFTDLGPEDLLIQIIRLRGTPSPSQFSKLTPPNSQILHIWPLPQKIPQKPWSSILHEQSLDPLLSDLLDKLFAYDPEKRCTALQALAHPYFDELREKDRYEEILRRYRLEDLFFWFGDEEIGGVQGLVPQWTRYLP